ncbi:hypothetical protein CI1B_08460 [Bradyrhizobium ivorense]|uniref:Uncharacterized protein n=1 Tax=Bradyrhizobium ivorense TaxID=2511166 RepID=A0A508ST88_9BRAD|nr:MULTISPECIES: hypothetical protein [Bradyrhizobium]QOZ24874.1 hypothetical protein XH93_15730 [Bradyrhizobium sp. CCBAU 51753]VIO65739.1 hypothetical protein CI1B_08460 [Bradyrhizobium ivorense]
MSDPASNAPRRYVVDGNGHRVLVGLSREETSEFERLEASFQVLQRDGAGPDQPLSNPERRWRELYGKHDVAWLRWIADLRGRRERNLPVLN